MAMVGLERPAAEPADGPADTCDREIGEAVAEALGSPFRIAWLDVRSPKGDRAASAGGVLVMRFGSPFVRIKFDRRADVPGHAGAYLVGPIAGRLASVRFHGEKRAAVGGPRSVVAFVRLLAERPDLADVAPEEVIADLARRAGRGLAAAQRRQLAEHLAQRFPPGRLADRLLAELLGCEATAAVICHALAHQHVETARSLAGLLAAPDALSALCRAVSAAGALALWPLLVSSGAAAGPSLFERVAASTGRDDAFGVLRRLPFASVAMADLVAGRGRTEAALQRRHRFFGHLVPRLRSARKTLAGLAPVDVAVRVSSLVLLADRAIRLELFAADGHRRVTRESALRFGALAHHPPLALEPASGNCGTPVLHLRELVHRAECHLASAPGGADETLRSGLAATVTWIAHDPGVDRETFRLAAFPRLVERAGRWRAHLIAAALGPWPCALAAPYEASAGGTSLRFEALTRDAALGEIGVALDNCLAGEDHRRRYRLGCVLGSARLFGVVSSAGATGGRCLALLQLKYLAHDGWTVGELAAARGRPIPAGLRDAAERFARHYTAIRPTAFDPLVPPDGLLPARRDTGRGPRPA